jgi:hypothetical protein
MGQPVAVTVLPSTSPGRVRLELNRSLTGMGHERFTSAAEAKGEKPASELARRLFALGSVSSVHVYGSMVTVEVRPGADVSALQTTVENLHQYWKPGMQPPSLEELMKQVPASAAPAAAGDAAPAGDASANPDLARVPAHLLARSQAALAKARAKA